MTMWRCPPGRAGSMRTPCDLWEVRKMSRSPQPPPRPSWAVSLMRMHDANDSTVQGSFHMGNKDPVRPSSIRSSCQGSLPENFSRPYYGSHSNWNCSVARCGRGHPLQGAPLPASLPGSGEREEGAGSAHTWTASVERRFDASA